MNATDFILLQTRYGKNGTEYPLISRGEWDANGNMIYHGIAPRGSATSSAAWLIAKSTYDAQGQWLYDLISNNNVKWDDRATISYS